MLDIDFCATQYNSMNFNEMTGCGPVLGCDCLFHQFRCDVLRLEPLSSLRGPLDEVWEPPLS